MPALPFFISRLVSISELIGERMFYETAELGPDGALRVQQRGLLRRHAEELGIEAVDFIKHSGHWHIARRIHKGGRHARHG